MLQAGGEECFNSLKMHIFRKIFYNFIIESLTIELIKFNLNPNRKKQHLHYKPITTKFNE